MYGKFFSSAFTGSMYGSGEHIFAVWGYVIANAVKSTIELNPIMLAGVLGTTKERVEEAITFLCQPDPLSRNPAENGRRLVREGMFQYRVVSHELYRRVLDEESRREYNRVKQKEHRQRVKKSLTVNDSQLQSSVSAHTEAEEETINTNTTSLFGDEGLPKRDLKNEVIGKAWDYYREIFERRSDYDFSDTRRCHADKAWKSLNRKCKELGIQEDERPAAVLDWLCAAIEFMKADKFHNGQNDQRTKYNDWEYLFRGKDFKSPDKLTDFWLNNYKFPNRGVKL
jgi:hypothetical protein